GIDALATLVGQRADCALAEQRAEPARQVAADHVAGLRIGGPAGDEMRKDRRAPAEPALQRILEIEQAEIILAPLAHDHRTAAVGAPLRPGAAALAPELTLEVLGVGRDPYRALRFFGPQRGRSKVAERLADPGARLGKQQVRHATPGARGEHAPGLARVGALAFTALGMFAGQLGEARLDGIARKLDLCRLRPLGRFLPF